MAEDRISLTAQAKALMENIRSLPPAENDEQLKALEGLTQLADILGEMSASAEAFLNRENTEDQ